MNVRSGKMSFMNGVDYNSRLSVTGAGSDTIAALTPPPPPLQANDFPS